MRWFQFFIILQLIAILKSKKLTDEENSERLEQCGKLDTKKIFNGAKVQPNAAPWAVVVLAHKSDGHGSCSGTLLSPRHVLTATHCVANDTDLEWIKTRLNYPFDREKCTENDHFIIPEIPASRVQVVNRKYESLGRAKYLYLLNFCRVLAKEEFQIQRPDDIMVIELSEDVEYASEVQPACLATSVDDNPDKQIARFYGYGDNPKPGVAEIPKEQRPKNATLLTEEIDILPINVEGTVNRMDPRLFKARSHSKNSITCPGDSGGGAVRNLGDGRITVIGVFIRSSCVFLNRHENGEEIYMSAGFYAEEICDLTGICTPLHDSESATGMIFNLSVLLIPMFFWFIQQ